MDDNKTDKSITVNDASQVLGYAFNKEDNSLTTGGFLVGAVGRKIEVTYPSATVEVYTYKETTDVLYVIQVTYTTASKDVLLSVERTS